MLRMAVRPLLLAVLAVGLSVRTGSGAEPESRPRPFGLRATSAARFKVEETRRLLEAREWDRAFALARETMEDMPNDLFEVEQTQESERWRPAASMVREMLLALPKEARERYDDSVAARSSPLAQRALATGDLDSLKTLWRYFGTSRYGLDAARLLIELAFEAGNFRDAAALAREALRTVPEDPNLWLRLAQSLAEVGDGAALAALRPSPDLSVTLGGQAVPLDETLQELRKRVAPAAAVRGRPMWGGRPSRDLSFPTEGARAISLRWSHHTTLELRERDVARLWPAGEGQEQEEFAEHLDAYFPMFPAAEGGLAFVSDGRSLRALDVLSGRPAWVFDAATAPFQVVPLLKRGATAHGRTALDRPFAPTVWRDLVIATIELDRPFKPDWLMQVLINTHLPRRALVAVDRQSGTLRWMAGLDPYDRLRLSEVNFASEAVVADDLVFAVGSRRPVQEEVGLFAFDAATGALRWETPLVYGQQETNLFGNPVKEFSAGIASAAEGVVYVQTGLGCVAAVEARSGTLRWIASYAIDPIPKVLAWYIPPLRIPRVGPVAPLISGDMLVVAPGDALHISAFDRKTGALRWRVPHGALETPYKSLGHVLGVARVRGRDAVIVTGGHVDALDLANGKLLARGRLDPEGAKVVGDGAIAGRTVLVPTTEGVQRFSLDQELKLLGRDPWPRDGEPGNLLPLGQVLVVAGRESVHGFYAWEDVEREITRRREERPKDPEVLVEAGEIYLKGRGGAEARRAFEAALALTPPGSPVAARARRGLVASWLAEGDAKAARDPAGAAAAFVHALAHTSLPGERASVRLKLDGVLPPTSNERIENLTKLYEESGRERGRGEDGESDMPIGPITLVRLANVEADAGRPAKAVAALQRLIREQGDVEIGPETAGDVARRSIAALIQRFGAQAYAEEEARARALMERGDPGGAALEQVLREYPNAAVVPEALQRLGQRQLAEGRAEAAAERFRQVLAGHPDRPEAPVAMALLAHAYGLAGAFGGRDAALEALAARVGEAGRVEVDGRSYSAAEWAERERGALPGPARVGTRRSVKPPLVERAFEPPSDEEITVPVLVADEDAEPSTVALTNRGASRAQVYDLLGARPAWALEDVVVQRAAYAEDTLVVALRGEWRGLDPRTGRSRWERQDPDAVQETIVAHGQVVSSYIQILPGRSRRRLEACDPVTGHVLWSLALGGEHVHGLRVAGPWVLLTRARTEEGPNQQAVLVIDALTGALRREIPFPMGREMRDLVHGTLFLTTGVEPDNKRVVTALDLATGDVRWTRALPSVQGVSALVAEGPRAWALQQDGTLTGITAADGQVFGSTRLSLGANARASPAFGTEVDITDGRCTLLASPMRGGAPVLQFEIESGRLLWEVDPDVVVKAQQQALVRSGDHWVVLLSGQDLQQVRRVVVRIVNARTGEVAQRLEPQVRVSAGVVSLVEGHGTLVVVTSGGTNVFGGNDQAEPQPAPAPGPAPRER